LFLLSLTAKNSRAFLSSLTVAPFGRNDLA
jgi:hypothetical protein